MLINNTAMLPMKRESAHPSQKPPRRRDPEGTREAILKAAREILAKDGKEGLRVFQVAKRAGVNRGTAYQHFPTREQLIEATAESVSQKIFDAVYDNLSNAFGRSADSNAIKGITEHLADFAMENPELSRAWLFELLSSSRPANDRFWRQFESSFEQLAKTSYARANIDTEVVSVLMLAGIFIWPLWARAHARNSRQRQQMTQRLAREVLRLSMYGTLNPDKFPELKTHLGDGPIARKAARSR
jgi:AcrR family transcriptional regulator